jgi:predicted NUDIX family phosphoesterase
MIADPTDSLEREKGYLPVEGAVGSIMNPDVLEQMRLLTLQAVRDYGDDFRIHVVDTSSKQLKRQPKRTVEKVADIAMDTIEQQLREDILFVPREKLRKVFGGRVSLDASVTSRVKALFKRFGQFSPREEVEADSTSVQALPVVVVRNKSGDVLQLKRNEIDRSNPLHEKLVIWAGGHVRSEDGENGEAIKRGAARELKEELRLSVEAEELSLLGSIYVDLENKSGKHVAIVYEWRADTDDVAVVLSNSEFYERRGNSLSGRFVKVSNLVRDHLNGKLEETWSREIVREFLAPDTKVFPARLF